MRRFRGYKGRKIGSRPLHTVTAFMVLCLIVLLANGWIMSMLLPSLNHSDLLGTQKLVESNMTQRCPDFGCPIYPAEITPYLEQLLREEYIDHTRANNFSFGTDRFALLTQMGKSHFYNQDRSVVVSPFVTSITSEQPNESFLVGVFDGHGTQGHIVADHVARDLPERLANELNQLKGGVVSDEQIIRALNKTFVEVDIYAPPNFLLGGTTATVSLRIGSKLYVANTGDSQTIIVSAAEDPKNNDPVVAFMTRKDKAILPDEMERIQSLNGTIHVNPAKTDSRVIVRSAAARDVIGLAMSRSIGDWEWKAVGVTAEPLVDVIDLNKYPKSFLIAGSDGIWDVRRREFYAKQFAESFLSGNTPPLFQCWQVIRKITPKAKVGYRDDMTALVMKL